MPNIMNHKLLQLMSVSYNNCFIPIQALGRRCTTSPRASSCLAGHASSAVEEDGKNQLREAVGSKGSGVQAVDYIVWRASLIWLLRTQARKQKTVKSSSALAMKACWMTLCQSHTHSVKLTNSLEEEDVLDMFTSFSYL